MKIRYTLLFIYFASLTAIFLRVPWQRRVAENWKDVGYSWVWGPPTDLPSVAITRINLAQLGVEFCALTAFVAMIFVLTYLLTYRAKGAVGAVRGIPAV